MADGIGVLLWALTQIPNHYFKINGNVCEENSLVLTHKKLQ